MGGIGNELGTDDKLGRNLGRFGEELERGWVGAGEKVRGD